jgi:hypothetical protein
MRIQCLIRRAGVTPIPKGKMNYQFQPVEEYDEQGRPVEATTSVCDVTSEEHVAEFLKDPNFRIYVPAPPRMVKPPKNPMEGISFQKFNDKGYIVADLSKPKKKRYAGADETWVADPKLIREPFPSEMAAFEWARMEIQAEAGSRTEPDPGKASEPSGEDPKE